MFEPMRRHDRELPEAEMESLLVDGEYGILSLAGRNGFPHPVPMNYVYRNGEIWLHCALEGSKLLDLRADSRAAFCVVGPTELLPSAFSTRYRSVIAYGRIEEVSAGEAEPCLVALLEKYAPDHLEQGLVYIRKALEKTCVLRMVILHKTGKARK